MVSFVGVAMAVVGFVAALAVLDAERANPEANIASFGDALWWAATTVTTVGYGDQFPTTAEGRFVAVGLMLTGIALLGVITAALVSWFVEKVAEAQAAEERTEGEVADLVAEVRALRRELAANAGDPGARHRQVAPYEDKAPANFPSWRGLSECLSRRSSSDFAITRIPCQTGTSVRYAPCSSPARRKFEARRVPRRCREPLRR